MSKKEEIIPTHINFVIGGLSGIGACCVTHPLDLVKTRMQLSGEGAKKKEFKTSLHAVSHIVRNEGIFAIYNGLSASVLRQATFTSARLGVYSTLIDLVKPEDGTPPTFFVKTICGLFGGIAAAFVGTPADVALIRMAADGRMAPSERRNYKNVFDALSRMVREEGVLTLWRGTVPTMTRAIVVNVSQVATYNQCKEYLQRTGYFIDDLKCHLVASMVSGICTTMASLPVDMAKTRLQNMKDVGGKREYKGMIDVIVRVVQREGVFALWKGITPAYMRIGPHTAIFFVLMEKLTWLYRKFVQGTNV